MYSRFHLLYKYAKYLITASNGSGHGIHSPFVYDFIENVLTDDREFYVYQQIEQIRKYVLNDNTLIEVEDLGAGSTVIKTKQRSIASIAATSLRSKKFAQLLFRIVLYYQPTSILEIGTSLGITTAYLASAELTNNVITIEGANSIADVALRNFKILQLSNIRLVRGNFDEVLPGVIQNIATIDFAFIDGNHRYEPTIQYFEQILLKSNNNTILVFDDIHWSQEMENAWHYIQQHAAVTLSIDLFFMGIVLLKKEFLQKQHFTIRF